MTDGQWHHIAYVRRGTSLLAYRDAVLVGSNSSPAGITIISNAAPLTVGTSVCLGFSGVTRYRGLLDDLKIYGWALTPAQVLLSAGLPQVQSNRPSLQVEASRGSLLISWPSFGGLYSLEANDSGLHPAGWFPVRVAPFTTPDGFVSTNPIEDGVRFFRLRKQ